MEREISPGVYVTDRPSERPVREEELAPYLAGGVDQLRQEACRLRNAIHHLLRSNDDLRAADPDDPDFQEAIAENRLVVLKYERLVRAIDAKLVELCGDHVASVPPQQQQQQQQQPRHHDTTTTTTSTTTTTTNPGDSGGPQLELGTSGSSGVSKDDQGDDGMFL